MFTKKDLTNVHHLRLLITEAWNHIVTRRLRRTLINSINKRLRKCIEVNGELVKT